MTQGSVRYNSIYVYIGIVGGLLVLCFTVSLAAQQTDEEQSAHYARGSRAMQLGLYDEAVDAFQQVLQLNPQNAEAHCELGAVYRFKEKTNDSIDTYLRALELPAAPQTHGVAHLCLARIYYSQGRFMDAEKHGQHAVDLLPKIAEPFFRLADTYIQKCQWRCTMQGYYGIGEVFVKVANLERAAAFYRDSLGFEVVERNNRQLYIYLETGHLVLKEAGSPGHDAGGPMHFAFVTSTQRIEQLVEQFASLPYRTRGPFDFDDPRGKCRAFFIFDPDGNEIEFNDLYYPDNSL